MQIKYKIRQNILIAAKEDSHVLLKQNRNIVLFVRRALRLPIPTRRSSGASEWGGAGRYPQNLPAGAIKVTAVWFEEVFRIVPKMSSSTPHSEYKKVVKFKHWSCYNNNFKHIRCLGSGGFGHVFEAKHNLDGNLYAVKRVAFPEQWVFYCLYPHNNTAFCTQTFRLKECKEGNGLKEGNVSSSLLQDNKCGRSA